MVWPKNVCDDVEDWYSPPPSASATLQWLNLLSRLSTLQTTFSMWTG